MHRYTPANDGGPSQTIVLLEPLHTSLEGIYETTLLILQSYALAGLPDSSDSQLGPLVVLFQRQLTLSVLTEPLRSLVVTHMLRM